MSEKKYKEFVIIEYPGLGPGMRSYGIKKENQPLGAIKAMLRNGAIENYYEVIEHAAYADLLRNLEIAREALKIYSEQQHPIHHGTDFNQGCAKKALKEIEK